MLTYRRPDDLHEALTELEHHVDTSGVDGSILVIDNDDQPSAEPIVRIFAARGVRYVHEPTPGIAAARNRALDETTTRLLIFIDDDERPQDAWLESMVSTWESRRPAAVVGPVVSTFSGPLDPWIAAGGYFDRLRHRSGTAVPVAATNNLLLDLDIVREMGLRFDHRFSVSGGSDTVFTRALVAGGGTIIWCDEAVVTDVVPVARLTRRWVVHRAQRLGNSESRAAVVAAPSAGPRLVTRLVLTARGVVRVVVGSSRAAYGVARRSDRHHGRGIRTMARGRGMIGGAWGHVVRDYERASPPANSES